MRHHELNQISDCVNKVIVSFAPIVFSFFLFLLSILFFLALNTVRNTQNINKIIMNQSETTNMNRNMETRYQMTIRNISNERMTENNRIVKVMEAIIKILKY